MSTAQDTMTFKTRLFLIMTGCDPAHRAATKTVSSLKSFLIYLSSTPVLLLNKESPRGLYCCLESETHTLQEANALFGESNQGNVIHIY